MKTMTKSDFNDVNKLSKGIIVGLANQFGKKCSDICVKGKKVAPKGYFCIDFVLYDYIVVICEYKQGLLSFFIPSGSSIIRLKNVYADENSSDIKKLLADLDNEITLRIPDKYLKAKGWV